MLYRLGDQFFIEGQIWEIAEFGTDSEGWLCAHLEWRDIPTDKRGELLLDEYHKQVPAAMIVRDLASLKAVAA